MRGGSGETPLAVGGAAWPAFPRDAIGCAGRRDPQCNGDRETPFSSTQASSGIGEYLYMARTGQEKSGRRGRGRPAAEERFPAAAASRLRVRRQSRFWIWVIFRHFLGFGLAVAWLAGRPGIPRSGSAPVQILPANPCLTLASRPEKVWLQRRAGCPLFWNGQWVSVCLPVGINSALSWLVVPIGRDSLYFCTVYARGLCSPEDLFRARPCLRRRMLFICAGATPCRAGSPILDDVRRLGPAWFVRIWGATLAALQNVQSCGGLLWRRSREWEPSPNVERADSEEASQTCRVRVLCYLADIPHALSLLAERRWWLDEGVEWMGAPRHEGPHRRSQAAANRQLVSASSSCRLAPRARWGTRVKKVSKQWKQWKQDAGTRVAVFWARFVSSPMRAKKPWLQWLQPLPQGSMALEIAEPHSFSLSRRLRTGRPVG